MGECKTKTREMVKIAWVCKSPENSKTLYGGKTYEKQLLAFLSKKEEGGYDVSDGYPHSNRTSGMLRWAEELYRLSMLDRCADVLIRDFYSSAVMGKTTGRNIAVIHHMDSSQKKHPFINKLLEKKIIANLDKIDTIVTVSEYWKEKFEKMGHNDVRVVYNGFDLSSFDITDEEVTDFKERHGLVKKPIIYLGNPQRAKGVVEAYRVLKKANAYLVTSGEKGRGFDLPVLHFDLGYREYLTLLKASSAVVALSKFKEGWNRTAHEAMLCKTPVVGVAQGGMEELLTNGNQLIYSPTHTDWLHELFTLPELVEMALMRRTELGEAGYDYASQFAIERFEKEWNKVLKG